MTLVNIAHAALLVTLLIVLGRAYIQLEFGRGKLRNRQSVMSRYQTAIREREKALHILTNKLNTQKILTTTRSLPHNLYKLRGTRDENKDLLLSLEKPKYIIDDVLPTDFPGLPYLLRTRFCLAWTNTAINEVYRWLGDCGAIRRTALNHTNWRNSAWKANTADIPKLFTLATVNTNKKVYFVASETSKIYVVSPLNTNVHYHTVRYHMQTMFYGEGYVYYTLHSGFTLGRYACSILDIPHDGPYSYGGFADVMIPKIHTVQYFRNGYIFLIGEVNDSRTATALNTFRLLDTNTRLVKPICLDAGGWDIFTRWNKNSHCQNRFHTYKADVIRIFLLTYVPFQVHLYVQAEVRTTQLHYYEMRMEWAFKYGEAREGFTPYPMLPATPLPMKSSPQAYQDPTTPTAPPGIQTTGIIQEQYITEKLDNSGASQLLVQQGIVLTIMTAINQLKFQ